MTTGKRRLRFSPVVHTLGDSPLLKERLLPKSKRDVDLHQPRQNVDVLLGLAPVFPDTAHPHSRIAGEPLSGWRIASSVPKAMLASERLLHGIQLLALVDGFGSSSRIRCDDLNDRDVSRGSDQARDPCVAERPALVNGRFAAT
jgi:hypothetical protein